MATLKCPKCGSQVNVSAGGSAICPGCNSKLRLKDTSTGQAGPTSRASAEPAAEWYYADASNERVGPVTTGKIVELIRSGDLHSDSLVWKDGMGDWAKLGMTELARLLSESPGPRRVERPTSPRYVSGEEPRSEPLPRAPSEMEAIPLNSPGQDRKTPFGIAWVAAYSALSGLLYVGYGIFVALGAGLLSGSMELGRGWGGGSRGAGATLVAMLLELLAVALMHLGILHLACTCGLLMRQRWGLSLARVLYVISGVVALIVLVLAIAYKSGILSALFGLLTVVVVLVYLYGGAGAMQSFRTRLRAASARSGPYEDSWR